MYEGLGSIIMTCSCVMVREVSSSPYCLRVGRRDIHPVFYRNMNSGLDDFANKAFDSSIRSIESERVCGFDSTMGETLP